MAGMRFADALVNRHTFVRKAILVAVCLCPVTDISVTVAPITAREILHNGTVPFGGGTPGSIKIRNFRPKFWSFDREYLENGKSQRYMSIRA